MVRGTRSRCALVGDVPHYAERFIDRRAEACADSSIRLDNAVSSPRRLGDRVRVAGRDVLQAGYYCLELAIQFLGCDGPSLLELQPAHHAGGLEFHPLAAGAEQLGTLFSQGRTGSGDDVGAQIADVGDPRRIGLIAAILLWGDDASCAQLANYSAARAG